MCLGIPTQSVALGAGPDLAAVDMAGAQPTVNVAPLGAPGPTGDRIVVPIEFALDTMTAGEAADALRVFTDPWEAEAPR